MRKGMSLEDSRNYIMTGSLDGNIPAKARAVAVGMFLVALGAEMQDEIIERTEFTTVG